MLSGKLAVAVINHDIYARVNFFYGTGYLADLLCGKCGSVSVAAGALDEHGRDAFIRRRFFYCPDIRASVGLKVDLSIVNAIKLKRTVAIALNTDGISKRIIRKSGCRKQRITGLEHGKQRR